MVLVARVLQLLLVVCAFALASSPSAFAHLPEPGQPHTDQPQDVDPVEVNVARAELTSIAAGVRAAQMLPPPGLPVSWCGSETRTDNAGSPGAPHVKLVYAYPLDRPNRFATYANVLQGNVAAISRYLAAESGNRKSLRFDMGTSCGAQYVDIQVVGLSLPRDAYLGPGAVPNSSMLFREIKTKVGKASMPRNYLVYADSLSVANPNGVGQLYHKKSLGGTLGASDRPDATNIHNYGELSSLIYGTDGFTPAPDAQYYEPGLFLHEASHNLGAVQYSAPRSSGGGVPNETFSHCYDEWDVMCYADGGPRTALVYPCNPVSFAVTESFDCGRDDYFNPAPPPGSYLTTHWNVYNSVFMAGCNELPLACTGGDLSFPVAVEEEEPDEEEPTGDDVVSYDGESVKPLATVTKKASLKLRKGKKLTGKARAQLNVKADFYADNTVEVTAKNTAFKPAAGKWTVRTCVRRVAKPKWMKGKDQCVKRAVKLKRGKKLTLPRLFKQLNSTGQVVVYATATARIKKKTVSYSTLNQKKPLVLKLTRPQAAHKRP